MKNKNYLLIFLISLFIGVTAMSFFNNYIELKFQYNNNNQLEIKHNLLIKVVEIDKYKKLINSPSFTDYVPNPLLIKGIVIKEDVFKENTKIKLIIPEQELKNIEINSIISLSLIDEKTVILLENLNKK